MIDKQQLEKFHQHLMAIQLAGIDIGSRMMDQAGNNGSPSSSLSFQGFLEQKLLEGAAGTSSTTANPSSGIGTGKSLYDESLQLWLADDQQIGSLQHLLIDSNLRLANNYGSKLSMLQFVIYCSLSIVSLFVVLSLSLRGMRGMVDQLRIEPTGILKSILNMSAHYGWLILLFCLLAGGLGWLLVKFIRSRKRLDNSQAFVALRQSIQAGQLAIAASGATNGGAQVGGPASQLERQPASTVASMSSPLIAWASSRSQESAQESSGKLRLVERLYQAVSLQHGKSSYEWWPSVTGLVVGGVVALVTSLLLFYPLVQLLRLVIDSSGVAG